ncbi:MAG TPA: hypothetical protein VGC42_13470 [Kofleriaceae bacterium]
MAETWLLCSACRTEIPYSSKYYQCSVSTCNRARMRLVFCSVTCWDSHVATARHREAWAEDKLAPSKAEWDREQAANATPDMPRPAPASGPVPRPVAAPPSAPVPERRVVSAPTASAAFSATPAPAGTGQVQLVEVADRDILVVVSKLKKYIKDRSGMNCSDAVAEVLSDHLRVLADDSIRAAGREDRKTVLDRDVPRPRRA